MIFFLLASVWAVGTQRNMEGSIAGYLLVFQILLLHSHVGEEMTKISIEE